MKVLSILGGRPHLIKAESIHRALQGADDVEHILMELWLGDYSDYPRFSDDDFELPYIDRLTRRTVEDLSEEIAKALRQVSPDLVLLYGDLPTTEAATPACCAFPVPFVHIESGYRSGDLTDPEERVRIHTSRLARHRIAFSENMRSRLLRENIDPSTVSVFGHAALQTLDRRLSAMMELVEPALEPRALVTFHHDENLNSTERLEIIYKQLERLSADCALRIILYQRTRQRLAKVDLLSAIEDLAQDLPHLPRVEILSTLSYDRYLYQLLRATFVLTDSSTMQDECAFLHKPCLVMREFTPREGDLGSETRLIRKLEATDLSESVGALRRPPSAVERDRQRLGIPYDQEFVSLLRSLM